MKKATLGGVAAALAMPLAYLCAVLLTAFMASSLFRWAWSVWADGLLVPGMEWSHEDGRVFTRRTDVVLAVSLALAGTVCAFLALVGVVLPLVAWRDRRRRRAASVAVPLARFPAVAAALAPLCRGGTGRLPETLILTTGDDCYLGPARKASAVLFPSRPEAVMGLVIFFLLDAEGLSRIFRSQNAFLVRNFRSGLRATLDALSELFWRMAAVRDRHSPDIRGEPQFPRAFSSRGLVLFPVLAGLLHVWLRQARESLEPPASRDILAPNLRRIRFFRARAVHSLHALCDEGERRLFLPDNLPLFLINGSRLARHQLGAFQGDAAEDLPVDSLAAAEPGFEKICKEATRAAYEAFGLEEAKRIPVDACISYINEKYATDPLFGHERV